jgi:hypothetical protein
MTPEELAALPLGTRVKFLEDENQIHDEVIRTYSYGTIKRAGAVAEIYWDDFDKVEGVPSATIVDTKSSVWRDFIENTSLEESC